MACEVEVRDAVSWAKRKFDSWIDYSTAFVPSHRFMKTRPIFVVSVSDVKFIGHFEKIGMKSFFFTDIQLNRGKRVFLHVYLSGLLSKISLARQRRNHTFRTTTKMPQSERNGKMAQY